MTRQTLLPLTYLEMRSEPLMGKKASAKGERRGVGEVAGGTAAECAAVGCFCPFALAKLVVVAVYKVPKGLCRKALKNTKRDRLRRRKSPLPRQQSLPFSWAFEEPEVDSLGSYVDVPLRDGQLKQAVIVEFEEEMWDSFYGAGFWRSPSQREGQ